MSEIALTRPAQSAIAGERGRASKASLVALLLAFAVVFLVPCLGVLYTSLKSDAEIAANGLWAPTGNLTLDNYLQAFSVGSTGRYLLNSVLVTVPATAVSVALGTLAGYAIAVLRPRAGEFIGFILLAGLFVPPQILLIPLFQGFNTTGMYDTLWPMIVVHSGYGISLCTLVMRNFFRSLPIELRAAGLVDGASEPRILASIVLPMTRPALAALATLQFTFIWNYFLYPLVFTRSDTMRTVMVGILQQQGQFSVAYGVQAAMAVLASLPTVAIFIAFQKHFIAGLTTGAVKG
ncbi:ABC-type glycerol-3-phosphate transport system permease component [Nonomuraea thailandensis]|uniref:ABC-type glycerol-3-phosphate transport system permease component n=1 Tax=Nonomuraea thailandensis TaxID=1188745 RepID=A0A9X2GC15_9ACTN|nr:carbohydrate ABC transporter permease [Nonomuraea thailandensis]MCP2356211.1 ABC-type glycerol-3-phosphate transport system permease component [Nonomuraea thailandensis]